MLGVCYNDVERKSQNSTYERITSQRYIFRMWENKAVTSEPTLCPNIIVLAVSPRCRGDGPMVITSEVLAEPVKILNVR